MFSPKLVQSNPFFAHRTRTRLFLHIRIFNTINFIIKYVICEPKLHILEQ
jgi:hypothetical protein